jgi:thiamine-monophosphate kinase
MEDEFRFIERLKTLIPKNLQGPSGIGDDAAVLPWTRRKSLLFTTDCIVEGVDFQTGRGGATPEAIGRKALAVNLSDIAAMGGKPLAFVATFGIPRSTSGRWVKRAAQGMIQFARDFGVAWVGGDLSRAGRFFISIALLGETERKRAVFRRGARAGDRIYVTGELGGSMLGRHLAFIPRLREADFLARSFRPTSMIDISDGFVQDLGHLLEASRAGAQVDLEKIPVSPAARRLAGGSRRKALRSALSDGEDFELLFTVPVETGRALERIWFRRFPGVPLTAVGKIFPGAPRINWRDRGKALQKLWFRKKGFRHF